MRSVPLVLMLVAWAAPVFADEAVEEFSLDEVEQMQAQLESGELAPDGETSGPGLEDELGELRWGMSRRQVLDVFKARLRAEWEPRIRSAPDIIQEDILMNQAEAAYRRLKSAFVVFDGRVSGWDVSPIGPEFRHGSQEAMLVVKGEQSRDFYFFINDRLWKFYRELSPDTFAGRDFDEVADSLQRRFGDAQRDFGARGEDAQPAPYLTWRQDGTQLVAIQRGSQFCLIFEDLQTLEHLALLRKNALPRKKESNSVVDAIIMSDADREKLHRDVDARLSSR
ncbi:MAG: hypothetical protein PVI30_13540 [Myxococcales bacterium]|jgi:hypothetical protein